MQASQQPEARLGKGEADPLAGRRQLWTGFRASVSCLPPRARGREARTPLPSSSVGFPSLPRAEFPREACEQGGRARLHTREAAAGPSHLVLGSCRDRVVLSVACCPPGEAGSPGGLCLLCARCGSRAVKSVPHSGSWPGPAPSAPVGRWTDRGRQEGPDGAAAGGLVQRPPRHRPVGAGESSSALYLRHGLVWLPSCDPYSLCPPSS